MMEPIQGEAGVVVPDPGYLKVRTGTANCTLRPLNPFRLDK